MSDAWNWAGGAVSSIGSDLGLSSSGASDPNTATPSVDYSAANQQAGNLATTQQGTFAPATQYQTGVLNGTQPSAAQIAGKQQTGMMHAANAAQANSQRGGMGLGNAAKNAMSANATGDAAIAGNTAAGTAAEKATAASGLGTLGYEQGGQQLQEQSQQAQQAMTPAQLQMANRGQNLQATGQNQAAFGNTVSAVAGMFDADLKEPGADEDPSKGHITLREEPHFLLMANHATGELSKVATQPLTPKERREATVRPHGAGALNSPDRLRTEVNDLNMGQSDDKYGFGEAFGGNDAKPSNPEAANMSGGAANAGWSAHYPGPNSDYSGQENNEPLYNEMTRPDSPAMGDPGSYNSQNEGERAWVNDQMLGKYSGPTYGQNSDADWKNADSMLGGSDNRPGPSPSKSGGGLPPSTVAPWHPPTDSGVPAYEDEYKDMASTPNSHGLDYSQDMQSPQEKQQAEADKKAEEEKKKKPKKPIHLQDTRIDPNAYREYFPGPGETNPSGHDIDMGGASSASDPFSAASQPDQLQGNYSGSKGVGKGGLMKLAAADLDLGLRPNGDARDYAGSDEGFHDIPASFTGKMMDREEEMHPTYFPHPSQDHVNGSVGGSRPSQDRTRNKSGHAEPSRWDHSGMERQEYLNPRATDLDMGDEGGYPHPNQEEPRYPWPAYDYLSKIGVPDEMLDEDHPTKGQDLESGYGGHRTPRYSDEEWARAHSAAHGAKPHPSQDRMKTNPHGADVDLGDDRPYEYQGIPKDFWSLRREDGSAEEPMWQPSHRGPRDKTSEIHHNDSDANDNGDPQSSAPAHAEPGTSEGGPRQLKLNSSVSPGRREYHTTSSNQDASQSAPAVAPPPSPEQTAAANAAKMTAAATSQADAAISNAAAQKSAQCCRCRTASTAGRSAAANAASSANSRASSRRRYRSQGFRINGQG
jgi:hypothetical protein